MSARTKRSMQKELRQPDEFVTTTGRVVEWGRQNQQLLTYAGIGVVAVLVALGLFSWWNGARTLGQENNRNCAQALSCARS